MDPREVKSVCLVEKHFKMSCRDQLIRNYDKIFKERLGHNNECLTYVEENVEAMGFEKGLQAFYYDSIRMDWGELEYTEKMYCNCNDCPWCLGTLRTTQEYTCFAHGFVDALCAVKTGTIGQPYPLGTRTKPINLNFEPLFDRLVN